MKVKWVHRLRSSIFFEIYLIRRLSTNDLLHCIPLRLANINIYQLFSYYGQDNIDRTLQRLPRPQILIKINSTKSYRCRWTLQFLFSLSVWLVICQNSKATSNVYLVCSSSVPNYPHLLASLSPTVILVFKAIGQKTLSVCDCNVHSACVGQAHTVRVDATIMERTEMGKEGQ